MTAEILTALWRISNLDQYIVAPRVPQRDPRLVLELEPIRLLQSKTTGQFIGHRKPQMRRSQNRLTWRNRPCIVPVEKGFNCLGGVVSKRVQQQREIDCRRGARHRPRPDQHGREYARPDQQRYARGQRQPPGQRNGPSTARRPPGLIQPSRNRCPKARGQFRIHGGGQSRREPTDRLGLSSASRTGIQMGLDRRARIRTKLAVHIRVKPFSDRLTVHHSDLDSVISTPRELRVFPSIGCATRVKSSLILEIDARRLPEAACFPDEGLFLARVGKKPTSASIEPSEQPTP